MPTCPRCQQFVESRAIECPTCRLTLKAHGHPGMTLHRAIGETYLCQTCTYDADDTCNFPKRPYAQECTLYHNSSKPVAPPVYKPALFSATWFRRYSVWLALGGLLAISIAIALQK